MKTPIKPASVPEGFASGIMRTVGERGGSYGHPQQNHQLTAEIWSKWLQRRFGIFIRLTPEDVCMLNVLQKCSRLAFTTKDDSWQDIAGYAENVAMLTRGQRNEPPLRGREIQAREIRESIGDSRSGLQRIIAEGLKSGILKESKHGSRQPQEPDGDRRRPPNKSRPQRSRRNSQ